MSKSNKSHASLNIRVALLDKHRRVDETNEKIEDSADVSRFGEMIHDIKN